MNLMNKKYSEKELEVNIDSFNDIDWMNVCEFQNL